MNEINYENVSFYLNTKDGAKKVNGYRVTGVIEGVAVHKEDNIWKLTDTLSGMGINQFDGSRDKLIEDTENKGLFDKLKEFRSTDNYKELCSKFGEAVEVVRAKEVKTSKSASKPASRSVSKSKSKVDFEIKKGTREGAFEVYFSSKPSRTVLDTLHSLNFRWNHKKVCWYGFLEKSEIEKALKTA